MKTIFFSLAGRTTKKIRYKLRKFLQLKFHKSSDFDPTNILLAQFRGKCNNNSSYNLTNDFKVRQMLVLNSAMAIADKPKVIGLNLTCANYAPDKWKSSAIVKGTFLKPKPSHYILLK